ncbi:MAG TPA: hypothetical protein VN816_08380 [Acidimicrobiales bacterium]|nr:hypothetical protein [Acidimicrobiales bacterium]
MTIHSGIRKAARAASVVLVGVAGLGVAGATSASARTSATSPAGSYTATILAKKSPPTEDALTLTAKGHFAFKKGPKGTWTETGDAITMTGKLKGTPFEFTIRQSGADLGSKAHPGRITLDGTPFAKWYAVPR